MEPKQTIVIDGETEQAQPLQQKREKHELTKATFALKYVLLLALTYSIVGIAYAIIFVGLFFVSIFMILLSIMFIKEIYSDISKQLERLQANRTLALAFTILSLFPPIIGAIVVLLFMLASKPNPTS